MSADYLDTQAMLEKLLGKQQFSMMAQQPQAMAQAPAPMPDVQPRMGEAVDPRRKRLEELLAMTPEEKGRLEGVRRAKTKAQGGSILDLFRGTRGIRQRELEDLMNQENSLSQAPQHRAQQYLQMEKLLSEIKSTEALAQERRMGKFKEGHDVVVGQDGKPHVIQSFMTPQGPQTKDLGVAPSKWQAAGTADNPIVVDTTTGQTAPSFQAPLAALNQAAKIDHLNAQTKHELASTGAQGALAGKYRAETEQIGALLPAKKAKSESDAAAAKAKAEGKSGVEGLVKSMDDARARLAQKLAAEGDPAKMESGLRDFDNYARGVIAREKQNRGQKDTVDLGIPGVTVRRK